MKKKYPKRATDSTRAAGDSPAAREPSATSEVVATGSTPAAGDTPTGHAPTSSTPTGSTPSAVATSAVASPLLHVRDVSKDYPGVRALERVELTVKSGSVHALVGENGAGKSTLIKCLAGVARPDHMELFVRGLETTIGGAADARDLGLAFIHQELNLIDYFTAGENVYLGHRLPSRAGLYDRRALRRNTHAIFQELGVDIPLDEPVRYLAPGERAMVAIARAFAREASVYFMDEPATALTLEEKSHLFAMIRRLTSQGRSVVYVSHNLDDVLEISGEITVLRDGRNAGHWSTDSIEKKTLITAMIGKEQFPDGTDRGKKVNKRVAERGGLSNDRPAAGGRPAIASELLSVEDLAGAGVGPVSLRLFPGEILGIGGLVGSGRSTLLKLIAGALPADTGSVRIHTLVNTESADNDDTSARSRTASPRSPSQALRSGIVLIPEERRAEGLALNRSVLENAIVSGLRFFSRSGVIDFQAAGAATRSAGTQVKLKTASYGSPVKTLSGGNQQKVLFARAVLARPRILLLDEPTQGVDVGARAEIYEVIRDLASRGMGIILVSSDFEEILALADRIQFLRSSRMGRLVENRELTQQEYLTLSYQGADDE